MHDEPPAGAGGDGPFDGVRTVGVVSDTHGRLRSCLFDELADADLVLHAGDVVEAAHLEELAVLAPVRAVWGNVDGPDLRRRLPEERELTVGGMRVAIRHGHQGVAAEELTSRFPDAGIVVHGHTHEPRWDRAGGTVILNPGSAGPRRAGKPVTAARVLLEEEGPRVEFLDLAD